MIEGFRPGPNPSLALPPAADLIVADLFDFKEHTRCVETLHLFDATTISAVLRLPPLNPSFDDQWILAADSKGIFSAANAYSITRRWSGNDHLPLQSKDWDKFWKIQIHDRLKLFLWKCMHSALPLRGLLARFQPLGDPLLALCPLYELEVESAEHLFLRCQLAQVVCLKCLWPLKVDCLPSLPFSEFVHHLTLPSRYFGVRKDSRFVGGIMSMSWLGLLFLWLLVWVGNLPLRSPSNPTLMLP